MTGARILAVGGVVCSSLTLMGGIADIPVLVGLGGAVMLLANLLVLTEPYWRD